MFFALFPLNFSDYYTFASEKKRKNRFLLGSVQPLRFTFAQFVFTKLAINEWSIVEYKYRSNRNSSYAKTMTKWWCLMTVQTHSKNLFRYSLNILFNIFLFVRLLISKMRLVTHLKQIGEKNIKNKRLKCDLAQMKYWRYWKISVTMSANNVFRFNSADLNLSVEGSNWIRLIPEMHLINLFSKICVQIK